MDPHYYLMKEKKILRLEADQKFHALPSNVQSQIIDDSDKTPLNQEQANWRVALFRDEIMELSEYSFWLNKQDLS